MDNHEVATRHRQKLRGAFNILSKKIAIETLILSLLTSRIENQDKLSPIIKNMKPQTRKHKYNYIFYLYLLNYSIILIRIN